MAITHIMAHYRKMKHLLHLVETGHAKNHPEISRLPVDQLENIRNVIKEFEEMGIQHAIPQKHARRTNQS